jgi:hypothetical protein
LSKPKAWSPRKSIPQVTFQYDSDKLEFISAAVTADGPLIELIWRAKAVAQTMPVKWILATLPFLTQLTGSSWQGF